MSEVSPLEELVPSQQAVEVKFGIDDHLVYTQRPLSFFGKMELFAVLGGAIDKALSKGGVNIEELLDDIPSGDIDDFKEAELFLKNIAKIVQFVPDALKDLYMVALAVPREEREYVISVMERPEIEGGLSDEQGIAILEVFVDQNWDVLLDFFKKKIIPLISKLMESQGSQQSKPLKATRRRTAKQS